MTLRNQLQKNQLLKFENNNNIFYQVGLDQANPFESFYLKLRARENRVYCDTDVTALPEINVEHPNKKEWKMRKTTLRKLISDLKDVTAMNILELGCGNGWLSNNLALSLNAEICAVDVNKTELVQGARVFRSQQHVSFVYGDIFGPVFNGLKFDAIILGACLQYFRDPGILLRRLFDVLNAKGSIYILDTPIYSTSNELAKARSSSSKHFSALGCPEMINLYFHHTFADLQYDFKILFDPASLTSRFKRKFLNIPLSIFPIICIRKDW
jgi:SAM-dependent methyltransferase